MTKKEILQALANAGVASAIITYDGSHDEGFIDTVTCTDASGKEIEIPDALRSAIDDLTHDILAAECRWWPNDDGAYGAVEIDVMAGTATFDHTQRVPHNESFEVSLREAE